MCYKIVKKVVQLNSYNEVNGDYISPSSYETSTKAPGNILLTTPLNHSCGLSQRIDTLLPTINFSFFTGCVMIVSGFLALITRGFFWD
jgi:hypothetical protein